jgi:hypothetical protein
MEDVLALYAEPYDPEHPVVCFDEKSKQLLAPTRPALSAQPGRPQRYDYEYERRGTRNLFVFFEPQRSWRHVKVTARRTKADFAGCMKELVDQLYPQVQRIRVVLDNLNTHRPSSLVETLGAPEAGRLLQKLEFHYTPMHGSWLNQVEIELGVLTRQCLDRRIGEEACLVSEISAWEELRNQERAGVNWDFTPADARRKFARFYPSISNG